MAFCSGTDEMMNITRHVADEREPEKQRASAKSITICYAVVDHHDTIMIRKQGLAPQVMRLTEI